MMPAIAPRSGLRDIVWPAVAEEANARMLALQFQYEQSERWPAALIAARQFAQIGELLRFADGAIPFWRDRLRKAGLRPGQTLTAQAFARLPILRRREVQEEGARLFPAKLPPGHGAVMEGTTSGSTGTPLRYAQTELGRFMIYAANLRLGLWHGFDWRGVLAISRPMSKIGLPEGMAETSRDWGEAFAAFPTGRAERMNISTPTQAQLDWLIGLDPSHLITFPSNAGLLARLARDTGTAPRGLRAIICYGEVLHPEIRDLCRDAFGAATIDSYSAEETGFLSLQCPEHDHHHHALAENVYLEVLNERDQPCGPGEVGRIVVTPLHNFAMPLLRYEIGDYAELGEACSCGRSLPVLRRILGRTRDVVRMPGGNARPAFWGAQQLQAIAPIIQYQLAQTGQEAMVFRLVARRKLTAAEEAQVVALAHTHLGHAFAIRFVYVDAIPRLPSGKFQDFVCEITG
jgi:phenylacetate-CoA ligase